MDNFESSILKMRSVYMFSLYWEMVLWVIKNSYKSNGVVIIEILYIYVCIELENFIIFSYGICLWLWGSWY